MAFKRRDIRTSGPCITGTTLAANAAIQENDIDTLTTILDTDTSNSIQIQELLHTACSQNHTDIARYLVSKGASPHGTSHLYSSPLHFASASNSKDVIKYLLEECHVDINQRNRSNETALYIACKRGYTDVIRILLENNASLSMKDGQQPLHLTIRSKCHGNPGITEMLLNHGADPFKLNCSKQNVFHLVCLKNKPDDLKVILDFVRCHFTRTSKCPSEQPRITINDALSARDSNKMTPLMYACSQKSTTIVKMLLENNVPPGIIGKDGRTPLALACLAGDVQIVDLLFLHGAKLNSHCGRPGPECICIPNIVLGCRRSLAKLTGTYSPLHIASEAGHEELVRYLLRHGADPRLGLSRSTPLHAACVNGNIRTFKILLEEFKGRICESIPDFFENLLHFAIKCNQIQVVKLLVENGVNVNACRRGTSSLNLSLWKNHLPIAHYLIDQLADVLQEDTCGYVPMVIALLLNGRKKEILPLLDRMVQKGATIPLFSAMTRTTLRSLCKFKDSKILVYLLRQNAVTPFQSTSHKRYLPLFTNGPFSPTRNAYTELHTSETRIPRYLYKAGFTILRYSDLQQYYHVQSNQDSQEWTSFYNLVTSEHQQVPSLIKHCQFTIRCAMGTGIGYKVKQLPLPKRLQFCLTMPELDDL